jgi:ArsR family transcriptional regulator
VAKADFFRALGHPARVRILQELRDGERTVGALQEAVGLDSSGASQHLAALRKQGLVVARREGTSVHYRVRDQRVLELLTLARTIIAGGLEESRGLLDELAAEGDLSAPPRAGQSAR